MHWRLVITLAIATAAMAPGYAQAAGMFCEPGQSWTTVGSGTIADDGWSVVNFTKPEGGAMQVDWTLEDFDGGPISAGFWFGFEPEQFYTGGLLYTNEDDPGVTIQADTADASVDRNLSIQRPATISEAGTSATLTLGPSWSDGDLHIFQYAVGDDPDGWDLNWTIRKDACLEDTDPAWGVASGGDPELLTAEDMRGPLAAQASVSTTPAHGFNGATALVEAAAEREVAGTPYLNLYWPNDASDIRLDGPGGYTFENLPCPWQETLCFGWGDYSWGNELRPGDYRFTFTGFTDPAQDPLSSTRGPYVTIVPTELPTQTLGGDGT